MITGDTFALNLYVLFLRIEAIWTLKDLLFTNGVRKNKETTNPIFEEKDERLTTTRQLTGNDENKDKVDQQLTGNDKNEDNVGRQLTGNEEADDNVEQMPPPKPKRSTRKSNPPQIKTKGKIVYKSQGFLIKLPKILLCMNYFLTADGSFYAMIA